MNKSESRGYFNGYQEALKDILDALDREGEAGAREWISNNLRK